jgi:predicted AAA+ superfamily ATPase
MNTSASTQITGLKKAATMQDQQLLGPFLARAERFMDRVEAALRLDIEQPDWASAIAFRYRKRVSGQGYFSAVRQVGAMRLDDLKEIDIQKEKIRRITEQFVQGKTANNVLLTGARGTGKSSLVRACLNTYSGQGLRLIEVDKADLMDLPDMVDILAQRTEKFIVFCDDLSFDQGEAGYKALKSVLDGSVSETSANVLIYATSNRRHLLPESMAENLTYQHTESGEVHPGEVVEEKISLSERFGLWVSFYPFTQDEYLTIVAQWLDALAVDTARRSHWREEALIWALERASRSGRVAWQFAKDFAGRQDPGASA